MDSVEVYEYTDIHTSFLCMLGVGEREGGG